jgi:hypothetical protein
MFAVFSIYDPSLRGWAEGAEAIYFAKRLLHPYALFPSLRFAMTD